MTYYVSNVGVHASRSQIALAPRYSDFNNAVLSMGEGLVFDDNGDILSFHERHLNFVAFNDGRMPNHPRVQ